MGNHRNSTAVDNDTTGMQGSSNMGDAIPLSDRPHTISSAYEKSGNQHQRPLDQCQQHPLHQVLPVNVNGAVRVSNPINLQLLIFLQIH